MTDREKRSVDDLMFDRKPTVSDAASNPPAQSELDERHWHDEALFWRELDGREPLPHRLEERLLSEKGQLRELRRAIHKLIREYVGLRRQPATIPQLELVRSSYDEDEILAAIDVILDDRMTMGPQVAAFESEWSAYLPAPFSVMVNSGRQPT